MMMRNEKSARSLDAFGSVLTAMVTPFTAGRDLDEDGAARLAQWLTRDGWNDGVVVNGTTGESFATSDREKTQTINHVRNALRGTGKKIIAGVGSAETRHSVGLAKAAFEQSADGLLVVAPYYSRPTQRGLLQHILQIADATPLPIMLYDIPQRTGVAIAPETLVAAARHPNIIAVKDAKGDLESSSWVMKETGLAYYCGEDALNLPYLAIGATGVVSVAGHFVADQLRSLCEAYQAGDVGTALAIHRNLLPVYTGIFNSPGTASAKAGLRSMGLPAGPVRGPHADLDGDETAALMATLRQCGSGMKVAA